MGRLLELAANAKAVDVMDALNRSAAA